MASSPRMRRGRAPTGMLWPIGLAVTGLLGIVAGGNLVQNNAAPASGNAGATQPAASTSPEDKKDDENPEGAVAISAAGSRDESEPDTTTGTSELLVSHEKLVFYASHQPYSFKESVVTLELDNVSDREVSVTLFAPDIAPQGSTLASTPPVPVSLVISEQTSGRRLSRQTQLKIPGGETRVLNVRPDDIKHTGVYSGTITLSDDDGKAAAKTISVKVVTTHGPLLPLLAIALGVIATTWVVFSRTVAREKTLFLLRVADLRQRLRQLCDTDRERRFSSRLEERCRDMLRQATRNWQQQNTAEVDAKLKECETEITSHTKAAMVTDNAEAALNFGQQVFVSHDQPRFLAGSLLLKQASTSLDLGDTARAESFAENALEVYHDAFGLYQRLKVKWQVIDELLDPDQLDADHRLGNARIMVEETRQRAETLIDNLSRGKEGVETTKAEEALQRLDYWKRALETVTDAIHIVPSDCDPAQRRLDRATELLATATLENVRLPRTAGHEDDLLKAEQQARAAVELCESQRLFGLLKKWLPENDGSLAAKKYVEAESEAAKPEGVTSKVLAFAREATARLQLTELERASWQWPDPDRRRDLLKVARRLIVAAESYQAALRKLPWEKSKGELASMLQHERMLFEACRAGEPSSDITLSTDPNDQIDEALKVLNQPDAQQVLARHYLFELGLPPLDDHPGVANKIKEARGKLKLREPFMALGTCNRILDQASAQENVAKALLSEAELVNLQPGDVAWESIEQARDHLANRQWARAMWEARKAWLLSRENLANFYIDELGLEYEVPGDDSASQKTLKVIESGGPGTEELADAKKCKDDEHWSRAVYDAYAARQRAIQNLAQMYRLKLADQEGPAARQAKEFADNDDCKAALETAIEQLARETVTEEEKVAKVARAQKELDKAQEALDNAQEDTADHAQTQETVARAKKSLEKAQEELDKLVISYPALATAHARLERHDYFAAYQAALQVLDSTETCPTEGATSHGVSAPPETTSRGVVHFDIAGFRAANIFRDIDFDIGADRGDQPPHDPVLEAKYRQAAAKRKKLAFRTDQIQIPQEWRNIFESYLPDTVALTDDVLAKAGAMTAFVEQNTDRISSMDASDAEQQATFRTALREVANGQPQEAQQQLDTFTPTLKVTLDCRNRGVTPVEKKAKVMGSDFRIFLNYISLGLFVRPQIDEESSVEDAFLFEAKIDGADEALRDRFDYEWKVERQAGGCVPPASWLKTWHPEEKVAKPRIDINQHGVMKVTCTVTDPKSIFKFEAEPRFFRVRRSPHRVASRLLSFYSIIEVVFVIVIASLIGLSTKYYVGTAETFGSTADYLLAFVWGATSKYGQEGIKSLTDLLTPSIRTDQSPAASAASET